MPAKEFAVTGKIRWIGNVIQDSLMDDVKDPNSGVIERLGYSVKCHCTCGVRGPLDSNACPACLVWHDMSNLFRTWMV